MEKQIIAIYCICDDFVKFQGIKDWHNVKMTLAEILTLAVVAMRFFYGNYEITRKFLYEHNYISKTLTKSGLSKRLSKLSMELWNKLLKFIEMKRGQLNSNLEYIVDTFPVSVCRNIRIQRCRIYCGEDFRGYNVSKKEYFYGLKASVIVDREGCPVEALLAPGHEHDITIFRVMDMELRQKAKIYGDSAFTDYDFEEQLLRKKQIKLIAERKANSLRPLKPEDYFQLKYIRKFIETSFGVISRLLPRKIHAVTARGFEFKILGFITAFAINFIVNYSPYARMS